MQQIQEGAPKETLYLKNLNEKISPEDTKYQLYFLFSQYGDIVDIQVKKNNALRGQAFVTFRDVTAATNAKTQLQNFEFFGKNIVIQFSRQRNDKIATLEGQLTNNQKKRRKLNKQQQNLPPVPQKPNGNQQNIQQQQYYDINNERSQLIAQNPVNSILHLENLPQFITLEMLKALFGQYPGYVESRHIPQRYMAFVEYQTEEYAQVAVQGLQGFRIDDHILKIEYAKKQTD